ncbi:hypothetical protein DITRI_Ditri08aG0120200 [Diplodiscus trichospermus]
MTYGHFLKKIAVAWCWIRACFIMAKRAEIWEKNYWKTGNAHQKDDGFSTSIIQEVDQWSFPRGSSLSPPITDNENGNFKLDSILFDEQEISALSDQNFDDVLLQNELPYRCPSSVDSGLFSPLNASDYACTLLQVSSTRLYIQDARTDWLDSSTFGLEPVEPNIDEGSWESRSPNYPVKDSLPAPPEATDELDLFLQESNGPQVIIRDEKTRYDRTQNDFSLVPDDQRDSSALAEPCIGKGLIGKRAVSAKTRGRNYMLKGLQTGNKLKVQADKGEGSTVKKQEHNAKEKIRRMNLHASYLALGSLLPDSSRSKKRKSTRLIIDRAVEYIPELEEEIEKLTLRKNDMLSTIKNKQPNQQLQDSSVVSAHRIKQGEFIVQICTQGHPNGTVFSNLLQKVEEEGMCIMSASALQVSDYGVCYHLHIQQMNPIASLDGSNCLASLKQKVISWLH